MTKKETTKETTNNPSKMKQSKNNNNKKKNTGKNEKANEIKSSEKSNLDVKPELTTNIDGLNEKKWDLLKNNCLYFFIETIVLIFLFRKEIFFFFPFHLFQKKQSNSSYYSPYEIEDKTPEATNNNSFYIFMFFIVSILCNKVLLRYLFYRMESFNESIKFFTFKQKLRFGGIIIGFFLFCGLMLYLLGTLLLNKKLFGNGFLLNSISQQQKAEAAAAGGDLQDDPSQQPPQQSLLGLLLFTLFYEYLFLLMHLLQCCSYYFFMLLDDLLLGQGFYFRIYLIQYSDIFLELIQLFLFWNLLPQYFTQQQQQIILPFHYFLDIWNCIVEIKNKLVFLVVSGPNNDEAFSSSNGNNNDNTHGDDDDAGDTREEPTKTAENKKKD